MISVCLPTRGRPQNMKELVESINHTTFTPVEVIFYIDDDDEPSIEQASSLDCRAVIGPRITMSDTYNRCAEVASGDILMECCDAVLFETPGWDELVEDEFAKIPDRIVLVFGADGIHNGRAATLPFLHRRWMEVVGRFMPPYFSADYCDTWVWEVATMLHRTVYLPDVSTLHRHPAAGTAPLDQTHEERMLRGHQDNVTAIFNSKLDERRHEAELLRTVMA